MASASSSTMTAPENYSGLLKKYLPLLVSLIAVLTYVATVKFQFVYDDNQQIVGDGLIRSWQNLPLLFKTDVWRFWNPNVVGNYWRPLFMVWLLVNFQLFGLNPVGWHLSSILLHAVATYLCYRVAERVTGDFRIAAGAALIFAVHPVHIETVAWISGATDTLMTVFFLSSLLCFLRADREKKLRWTLLSALLFACALLCKEPALALPLAATGCVALFPREGESRRWRQTGLALALYGAVIVLYFVARNRALVGVTHSRILLSAETLLLTWPSLAWFYLRHLLWPGGLALFYDQPPVLRVDWPHFWLPVTVIVAVTAAVVAGVRQQLRLAGFALLLLLLPLGPAFFFPALVPVDYAHDRYLYLPCFGFALLAMLCLQRLGNVAEKQLRIRHATVAMVVTVLVGLSVATSAQVIYFANDLLLFDRATRIAPGSLLAFDGLGRALLVRGQNEQAMLVYRQVLKIDPYNFSALYNVGLHDFLHQNYREADLYLSGAFSINPFDPDCSAVLADTRNHLGQYAAAEPAIRRAIALRPGKAGYRRVLAESLGGQGRIEEAIEQVEAEMQAHPDERNLDQDLLQRLQAQRKSTSK